LSERLLHPSLGDIPSFSQRSEDISIQNILREGSDEGQNVPTLRWFVGFEKSQSTYLNIFWELSHLGYTN